MSAPEEQPPLSGLDWAERDKREMLQNGLKAVQHTMSTFQPLVDIFKPTADITGDKYQLFALDVLKFVGQMQPQWLRSEVQFKRELEVAGTTAAATPKARSAPMEVVTSPDGAVSKPSTKKRPAGEAGTPKKATFKKVQVDYMNEYVRTAKNEGKKAPNLAAWKAYAKKVGIANDHADEAQVRKLKNIWKAT